MFRANAASVLNIGHVPKKMTMLAIQTIVEPTASCLHTSPGTRMPQVQFLNSVSTALALPHDLHVVWWPVPAMRAAFPCI
jgi:hypothetical protein